MPFQTRVNLYNPIGVEGDFATVNPRASVYAGEGALVAGPGGVIVGNFAWLAADGRTVTSFAQGAVAPTGFVHRNQQALMTQYLQEFSMIVPEGFAVTLHNAGDFLDKIAGGTASVYNSPVFASYEDGSAFIGAAPAGKTATGSIGATFTATGATTNLTVTAVTGIISVGDTLGTLATVPAGTVIVSQTSGTPGGAGVYVTSNPTTVAAATVTSFGNVLNVSAVTAGVLKPGDAITGTGIPAGVTIASQVSGVTGAAGVYTLSVHATAFAASTALTVAGGTLTKFVAKSAANVGELVVISTWGN